MGKPRLHGRDHRPGGTDALTSGNTMSGYLLAATGAGETRWDPPNASGIQFDTDPQTGTWLLVTTTGTHTSGSSNGILLKSTGGDILIDADDNAARMFGTDVFLFGDSNNTELALQSSGIAFLYGLTYAALTGGDTGNAPNYSFFEAHPANAQITAQELNFSYPGVIGDVLQIVQVAGNWTYHIKTGAAWVADL